MPGPGREPEAGPQSLETSFAGAHVRPSSELTLTPLPVPALSKHASLTPPFTVGQPEPS